MVENQCMLRPRAVALAVALALGLSGCGGGGGANIRPSTPPPANTTPPVSNPSPTDTTPPVSNPSPPDTTPPVTTPPDTTPPATNPPPAAKDVNVTVDGSETKIWSNDLSGAGGLIKDGTGTLLLRGNNTYTGGTIISDGTLQLGDGGMVGSIVGDVTDNGALVFNRSDDVTFDGLISGNGSLTQAGTGVLNLTGSNTYTGGTTISAGTLQLGDGGTGGSIVGDVTDNGALVFNRSDDVTFDGKISGSGSLTQVGSGVLTLDGNGSGFSGVSTVSHGSLVVGSTAGTGAELGGMIMVNTGATLGGYGSVGSVTSYGVLAPGSSTDFGTAGTFGTLTVNGKLTLANGSFVHLNLGAPGATPGEFGAGDNITVNGDLELDGASLKVSNLGDMGPGLYNLINYTGSLSKSNGGLSIDTAVPPKQQLALQYTTGQVNLLRSLNPAVAFWAPNGPLPLGGSGTWTATSASWTNIDGSAPLGPMQLQPSFAEFQGTPGTVTVDDTAGAISVTGMQFFVDGYTLAGNTTTDAVTLVSNSTGYAPVINVGDGTAASASHKATVGAVLAGTDGLIKTDYGTLVLTGTNTYTGGTTIKGGTLQLGNDATNGSIIGDVMNNGSLVFKPGSDLSYSGVISGIGSLVKSGNGTLKLTGASTYTGGTTVYGGVLEVASGSLGSGIIAVRYNGFHDATLKLDRATSLSNHILLDNGTLDNAGSLVNEVDGAAVTSGIGSATVLNHDFGSIKATNAAVMMVATYGILVNSSGGIIEGGTLGVGMAGGGEIYNTGVGSVISSSTGPAIQVASASIKNNDGGVIVSGSTAIYLSNGGEIINSRGSTIKTTDTGGNCQSTGGCGIFVPASTDNSGGELTLTNAGTIVGDVQMDPVASNAATLWAGGVIHGNLDMGPNSTLTLQGGAGTSELYSQAVTGITTVGSVSKSGSGTWIIDNDELDLTGVGIGDGTLQVGVGGTEGSIGQGSIFLYGTLVLNRSDNVVFNGDIYGGGGSLVQAGSGTLMLTGDYLSPDHLIIKDGTLQIGDGGKTGVTFFRDVLDNGSLVFDHDDDIVVDGVISGTGSLTQSGTGTLTLYGDNTYTGDTVINNGTLRALNTLHGNVMVNVGAALDGASYNGVPPGMFQVMGNLSSGGIVAIHGRDSTVVGDYLQSSTGTLAVSLGSKLAVLGTATLNGGTLEVTGVDNGYVSNTHTEVLTAGNGVSGAFDQLVKDSGVVFTSTTINYDANSVWLDTTGLNVTTAAQGDGVSYTPASMAGAVRVQGAFEQLDDKIATGTLSDVSDGFVRAAAAFQQAPNLRAAQASLESLSGQLHADSAAMTLQTIDATSRALSERLESASAQGDKPRQTWMRSITRGGGMARNGFADVGFQLNGWLVGSDTRLGPHSMAGFAFSQGQGMAQVSGRFDRNRSRNTAGMFYAGWSNQRWYAHGRAGMGRYHQNIERMLLLGSSYQGVWADYDGRYNVAYGESGLHFGLGSMQLTPFVDLEYDRVARNGFAEHGAGGFGLKTGSQVLSRWQSGVGLKLGREWHFGGGRSLGFDARAQWRQTLAASGVGFDASFVGLNDWRPLTGVGLSRRSAAFGFDLNAKPSANTLVKLGYEYLNGDRNRAGVASAHFSLTF